MSALHQAITSKHSSVLFAIQAADQQRAAWLS
jgi:hypothetical protein